MSPSLIEQKEGCNEPHIVVPLVGLNRPQTVKGRHVSVPV